MSIVYVAVTPSGVVFAADGVASDPSTHRVAGFMSKLILMPEMPCILGFTGMSAFGRMLYLALSYRYASFDAVIEHAEADCSALHADMVRDRMSFPTLETRMMSMAFGGWSARRQRFEAYRLTSYDKESRLADHAGRSSIMPAWTLHEITTSWASMTPTAAAWEAAGLNGELDETPVEIGIRVVTAGRASSGHDDGSGHPISVGGYAQVAVLGEGGIQSWIAKRWPDRVGEQIKPQRRIEDTKRIGGDLPSGRQAYGPV